MSKPGKRTVVKKNRQSSISYIWILILLALLFSATGSISPLWAAYVLRLGGNLKTAGIAVSLNTGSFAIFNLVWGWVETHYPNDKLYIIGPFLILTLLYLAYPLIGTPLELYALQIPLGMFAAMQVPALTNLYDQQLKGKESTMGWGIYIALINLSISMGALVGAHVAHYFGFDAVFYMMAGLAFVACISAAFIL